MRIPFPHWTGDELAARARQAGFGQVQCFDERRDLTFPGGIAQAVDAILATPIGPMVAALPPAEQAAFREAATAAFAPLLSGEAVRGPMRSWILVATA